MLLIYFVYLMQWFRNKAVAYVEDNIAAGKKILLEDSIQYLRKKRADEGVITVTTSNPSIT